MCRIRSDAFLACTYNMYVRRMFGCTLSNGVITVLDETLTANSIRTMSTKVPTYHLNPLPLVFEVVLS